MATASIDDDSGDKQALAGTRPTSPPPSFREAVATRPGSAYYPCDPISQRKEPPCSHASAHWPAPHFFFPAPFTPPTRPRHHVVPTSCSSFLIDEDAGARAARVNGAAARPGDSGVGHPGDYHVAVAGTADRPVGAAAGGMGRTGVGSGQGQAERRDGIDGARVVLRPVEDLAHLPGQRQRRVRLLQVGHLLLSESLADHGVVRVPSAAEEAPTVPTRRQPASHLLRIRGHSFRPPA
jgi:hypothetical protein